MGLDGFARRRVVDSTSGGEGGRDLLQGATVKHWACPWLAATLTSHLARPQDILLYASTFLSDIFKFSDVGATPTAITDALAGFCLPVARVVVFAVLWLCPFPSIELRGKVLLALEVVGRMSATTFFVDTFLLIAFSAVFDIETVGLKAIVEVHMRPGIVAFMCGQLVCCVLINWMRTIHEEDAEEARRVAIDAGMTQEPKPSPALAGVQAEATDVPVDGQEERQPPWVRPFRIRLLLVVGVLLGFFSYSHGIIGFSYTGLEAPFMTQPVEGASSWTLSILPETIKGIWENTLEKACRIFFVCTFCLNVVVAPACAAVAAIGLTFLEPESSISAAPVLPMLLRGWGEYFDDPDRIRRNLYRLLTLAYPWSAVEAFTVAAIFSALEIHYVASWCVLREMNLRVVILWLCYCPPLNLIVASLQTLVSKTLSQGVRWRRR